MVQQRDTEEMTLDSIRFNTTLWRFYPGAVPEIIQAGSYQQPPMAREMGLQLVPLPGLEFPHLKRASVGLCFWTPCCLML